MTGKRLIPYAFSEIALLVICLTVSYRTVYAAEGEAPAILQFARKYQQQIPPPDVTQPVIHQPTKKYAPPRQAGADRLKQLQLQIAERERQLLQKNSDIQSLEKKLAALQPAGPGAGLINGSVTPQNMQSLRQLVAGMRNIFSLTPDSETLVAELKQANQALKQAQLNKTVMQQKQQQLNQQISELNSQLKATNNQKNLSDAAAETMLTGQLQKLHQDNARLSADLATSRQAAQQAAEESKRAGSALQLAREKEASEQQLDAAQKQHSQTEAQQRAALQAQLEASRQQLDSLTLEKDRLQQQLAKAPSPRLLADSRIQVKSLQTQLDALSLQKTSASGEAARSAAALDAAKVAAEQKYRGLQEQLNIARQQLASLSLEKDRLQQQLAKAPSPRLLADSQARIQSLQTQLDALNLQQKSGSGEAARSAAALEVAKAAAEQKYSELQGQLDIARQQLTSLSSEKDRLQQQLAKAPSPELLADSLVRVKSLQTQLDAQNLQQKSGSDDATRTAAALEVAKAAAGQKNSGLQGQLDTARQQLASLTSEKDRLQQQLAKAPNPQLLADSQAEVKLLQTQLSALNLQQKSGSDEATALAATNTAAQQKIVTLQGQLDEARQQLAKQDAQIKTQEFTDVTPEKLKQKSTREAYAVGISLGAEIVQMQAENRNWAATDNDQPTVLAGIIDAFRGKSKLPDDALRSAITDVSKQVQTERKKMLTALDESTKKFLARFTKDKKTKKSDLGFWYRIDYPGDEFIPANASIDLVVKESLTNGVIIEDMDSKGIVLTQPIASFPPIFQEALKKLKNHGSIVIVVPPEHAYGEKGYPPKVPPNATMVYTLRISEFYPENTRKTEKIDKTAQRKN